MAAPVGHSALVTALDGFRAASQKALAPGSPRPHRPRATRCWPPTSRSRACLPSAFELEGERDRREPLIVRALLEQVAGPRAAHDRQDDGGGARRLSPLLAARADEIAAVTGIPDDIAAATGRASRPSGATTPGGARDGRPRATVRELVSCCERLRASTSRSRRPRAAGRRPIAAPSGGCAAQRQQTFLQITIVLARLGEVDLALRLEKLAFAAARGARRDRDSRAGPVRTPTNSRSRASTMVRRPPRRPEERRTRPTWVS